MKAIRIILAGLTLWMGISGTALAQSGSMTTEKNSETVTNVTLNADLVVCGGGLAGVCAAVSAARHGANVVLVQDRPVLGGNASSEMRMGIVGVLHDEDVETGILE